MSGGSDADLAVLRLLLEGWQRGDFWHAELYADDVVFVRSGPDGGEYHGIEGMTVAWRDFLGAWKDFRIKPEGVVTGADGMYVLLLRLQGRGKGSGVSIDAEVANLVKMQNGRVVRLEMHWDRDAALTAAGAGRDAG
jgi:ketosteroid isomerase-like protein